MKKQNKKIKEMEEEIQDIRDNARDEINRIAEEREKEIQCVRDNARDEINRIAEEIAEEREKEMINKIHKKIKDILDA